MMKKQKFSIEVEINYRPEYWQESACNKMKLIITKLKTEVKELGGKVNVRY